MYRCTRCNYIGDEFVQMSRLSAKGCPKCAGEVRYISSEPKANYVSPFSFKKEEKDK